METENKNNISDLEKIQLDHPVMDGQHLAEAPHEICVLPKRLQHMHFEKKVDENPEHMIYSAEFA